MFKLDRDEFLQYSVLISKGVNNVRTGIDVQDELTANTEGRNVQELYEMATPLGIESRRRTGNLFAR